MTDFRDREILTVRPDRKFDSPEDVDEIASVLESMAGPFRAFPTSDRQAWNHIFPWPCHSRADLVELEEFLDRRRGRYVPFWVPTWNADLVLAADTVSSTEVDVGTSSIYLSERYFAFITPAAILPRGIVTATDNLDGTTTLVVDSGLPTLSKNSTLISVLKWVRLLDDAVPIHFSAGPVIRAELVMHELPMEVSLL